MPAKAQIKDYVNKKYGRLTIEKEIQNFKNKPGTMISCKCECGNDTRVYLYEVLNGHTRSCGCLQKEKSIEAMAIANTKHGYTKKINKNTKHLLYRCYYNMMNRCYNKENEHYKSYGGRGIKVCKDWRNKNNYKGLDNFMKWAIKNGWAPDLEIDRRDNNKGYYPWNCRFVSNKINSSNRRTTIHITVSNRTLSIKQACEFYKIVSYNCALKRIRKGWDPIKAVKTPSERKTEQ